MKKYTKPLLIAGAVATIGTVGTGTAMTVGAVTNSDDSGSSLVDELAKKFNLNKSDVQKVFSDHRAEHQKDMQAKRLEKLKQALSDKKITQAQYDHIVSAWNDIDKAMQNSGDPGSQTKEQRQAVKKKMDELRKWMKEQKIDETSIMPRPAGHGPFKQ